MSEKYHDVATVTSALDNEEERKNLTAADLMQMELVLTDNAQSDEIKRKLYDTVNEYVSALADNDLSGLSLKELKNCTDCLNVFKNNLNDGNTDKVAAIMSKIEERKKAVETQTLDSIKNEPQNLSPADLWNLRENLDYLPQNTETKDASQKLEDAIVAKAQELSENKTVILDMNQAYVMRDLLETIAAHPVSNNKEANAEVIKNAQEILKDHIDTFEEYYGINSPLLDEAVIQRNIHTLANMPSDQELFSYFRPEFKLNPAIDLMDIRGSLHDAVKNGETFEIARLAGVLQDKSLSLPQFDTDRKILLDMALKRVKETDVSKLDPKDFANFGLLIEKLNESDRSEDKKTAKLLNNKYKDLTEARKNIKGEPKYPEFASIMGVLDNITVEGELTLTGRKKIDQTTPDNDIALFRERIRQETELFLANTSKEEITEEVFKETYEERLKLGIVEIVYADKISKGEVDKKNTEQMLKLFDNLDNDTKAGKPIKINRTSLVGWHVVHDNRSNTAAEKMTNAGYFSTGKQLYSKLRDLDIRCTKKYPSLYPLLKAGIKSVGWGTAYGIGSAFGPAGIATVATASFVWSGYKFYRGFKKAKAAAKEQGHSLKFFEYMQQNKIQTASVILSASSAVFGLGGFAGLEGLTHGSALQSTFQLAKAPAAISLATAGAVKSAHKAFAKKGENDHRSFRRRLWDGTKAFGVSAGSFAIGMYAGRLGGEASAELINGASETETVSSVASVQETTPPQTTLQSVETQNVTEQIVEEQTLETQTVEQQAVQEQTEQNDALNTQGDAGTRSFNADGKDGEETNVDGKGDEGANVDGKGDEGASVDGKDDEEANVDGKGDEGAGVDGKGDEEANVDGKGDEGASVDGKGDEGANNSENIEQQTQPSPDYETARELGVQTVERLENGNVLTERVSSMGRHYTSEISPDGKFVSLTVEGKEFTQERLDWINNPPENIHSPLLEQNQQVLELAPEKGSIDYTQETTTEDKVLDDSKSDTIVDEQNPVADPTLTDEAGATRGFSVNPSSGGLTGSDESLTGSDKPNEGSDSTTLQNSDNSQIVNDGGQDATETDLNPAATADGETKIDAAMPSDAFDGKEEAEKNPIKTPDAPEETKDSDKTTTTPEVSEGAKGTDVKSSDLSSNTQKKPLILDPPTAPERHQDSTTDQDSGHDDGKHKRRHDTAVEQETAQNNGKPSDNTAPLSLDQMRSQFFDNIKNNHGLVDAQVSSEHSSSLNINGHQTVTLAVFCEGSNGYAMSSQDGASTFVINDDGTGQFKIGEGDNIRTMTYDEAKKFSESVLQLDKSIDSESINKFKALSGALYNLDSEAFAKETASSQGIVINDDAKIVHNGSGTLIMSDNGLAIALKDGSIIGCSVNQNGEIKGFSGIYGTFINQDGDFQSMAKILASHGMGNSEIGKALAEKTGIDIPAANINNLRGISSGNGETGLNHDTKTTETPETQQPASNADKLKNLRGCGTQTSQQSSTPKSPTPSHAAGNSSAPKPVITR